MATLSNWHNLFLQSFSLCKDSNLSMLDSRFKMQLLFSIFWLILHHNNLSVSFVFTQPVRIYRKTYDLGQYKPYPQYLILYSNPLQDIHNQFIFLRTYSLSQLTTIVKDCCFTFIHHLTGYLQGFSYQMPGLNTLNLVYYLLLGSINLITTMRKSDRDQLEIKEELTKFINLLQADYSNHSLAQSQHQARNQYPFVKKLSIILSASEPECSSLDKQNSNPSANRSFESNQKPSDLAASRKSLLQTLMTTTLTTSQLKLIEKIREYIQELIAENERQNTRIQELKRQLSNEKKANDEMLNVLIKLDEQEKEVWNNYHSVSQKYEQLSETHRKVEDQLKIANESMLEFKSDNEFMKKLIFYASQNYQTLEKKCRDLELSCQKSGTTTYRKSLRVQSIDNLLKSAKTKKNCQSPSHSEVLRSPSPQNFLQVYRKMIIRTLKFKGRSPRIAH